MNVVKFKYYDEFHCIGPECKDSCCKYWHILVTKREYLDYKKMKCSPELRSTIDTAFKRLKNGTESQYAEMKLKENGDCPFLGDDSLCRLQKELGEDVLSLTCTIFPRLNTSVGRDTLLRSCDATCSHVVELLMKHPEGLEITEEEYDNKDKYINNRKGFTGTIDKSHKEYPYFWSILNAEIDILQNRSFTVPERMLILGYFCQKADGYIKNDEGNKISGLAEMLLDNELCRKIADSLTPSVSENRIDSESIGAVISMRACVNRTEDHINLIGGLFDRVFEYLECAPITEDGKVRYLFSVDKYSALCGTFRALEKERPYIIENLLVNNLFHYNPDRGVWGNYFDMAVFYNVLKICAPVFLPENYDDRELAVALNYAVKMVLNSKFAGNIVAAEFQRKERYTLPYAAFLIC